MVKVSLPGLLLVMVKVSLPTPPTMLPFMVKVSLLIAGADRLNHERVVARAADKAAVDRKGIVRGCSIQHIDDERVVAGAR